MCLMCLPSSSRISSRLVKSLCIVNNHAWGRMGGELARRGLCHFYLSWCGPSIFCWGGTVYLVFISFSEEIVPYVTVDFVCLWEGVSSGSSYTAILDHPLLVFIHLKFVLLLSRILLKWDHSNTCNSLIFKGPYFGEKMINSRCFITVSEYIKEKVSDNWYFMHFPLKKLHFCKPAQFLAYSFS